MNGYNVSSVGQRLQTIPDRILTFSTACGKTIWLFEAKFRANLTEGGLHPGAHHENDVIDTGSGIELHPGVCDDGLARDFEEQLIDVRPHAGAAAGGDDDGAGHAVQSPKSKVQSREITEGEESLS